MPERLDINLLPPEFRPAPPLRWTTPYLALLYSLAVFLVMWFAFHSYAEVVGVRSEVNEVAKRVESLKMYERAYDESQQAVESLGQVKTLFAYLDSGYVDWPIFMRKLQPYVPSQVWLTSTASEVLKTEDRRSKSGKREKVTLEHAGSITISGQVNGYLLLPIATFLNNLRQEPYFVNPVLLDTKLEEQTDSASRSFIITTRVLKLGGGGEDDEDDGESQRSEASATGSTGGATQ